MYEVDKTLNIKHYFVSLHPDYNSKIITQNKMLIIGITGGTGCGKTTVVNQIVNELSAEDVTVISQDSYYKDLSHLTFEQRTQINFDHPNSIDFDLLKEHLLALKVGKTIDTPTYSFVEHNRTKETVLVKPTNVVIVEGILIFSHPDIRDLFNIKIFVHADSDERLIRRIKRDITERGRDVEEVLNRYQNTLKPMHMQFIEPMKEFADIIIPNNRYNIVAIDIIKRLFITECIKNEKKDYRFSQIALIWLPFISYGALLFYDYYDFYRLWLISCASRIR